MHMHETSTLQLLDLLKVDQNCNFYRCIMYVKATYMLRYIDGLSKIHDNKHIMNLGPSQC